MEDVPVYVVQLCYYKTLNMYCSRHYKYTLQCVINVELSAFFVSGFMSG